MARKKRTDSELNLDSLMDALTNVVGILVIVLVMTSLDVSSAVDRIKRVRPQDFVITDRDLEKSRAELANQTKLLASLQQKTGFDADLAKLAEIQKEIERLKALLAVDPDAQLDELLERIKKLTETKTERSETLVMRQDRLQELKALLEETPARKVAPPKVVRVPNPRSAPEGIEPVMIFCRQENAFLFEPEKLTATAEKRAQFVLRPLLNVAGPSGEIDGDKLVTEFNKFDVSDRIFRVRMVVSNYTPYLQFEYQGGGETVEEFSQRSSKFQVALRRFDPMKQYAKFYVWSDSFDAYVQARRICDEYGLLAGWQPYHESYQWRTPLSIKVKIKGKPKPPPPKKRKPLPPGEKPPPPPPPLPNDQID
jgi:hypothetical protein